MGYNYSSSLTENGLLIQCRGSECGMKMAFSHFRSLLLPPLRGPRGIPHACEGASSSLRSVLWDTDPLTLAMVIPGSVSWEAIWSQGPSIVLLLGFLRGCRDCSMWAWRNLQLQCPRWQNSTSFVSSPSVPVLSLPSCTENPV